MTHDEMISVLAHNKNGGEVQMKPKGDYEWQDANGVLWNFGIMDYRIKPEPLVLWVEIDKKHGYVRSAAFKEFTSINGGAIKKFIEAP